jgi:hypothetical protein
LISCTGNSPNNIRTALNRDGQLAVSIRELDDLWQIFEQHRRFSKRRFILQAHPEFGRALDGYESHWKYRAMMAVRDWEAEQRGDEPPSRTIDRLFDEWEKKSRDNAREPVGRDLDERHEWEFDPDEHSAASEIGFAEEMVRFEAASGGSEEQYQAAFSRAAGAFKWLRETVGLDLAEVERRWKEFPVIIVPKSVSDKHGIEDPKSLFSYLSQVRLAYIVGADLAAIAMCRTATEILVRSHYNSGDKTTLLGRLIRLTEKRRDGSILKKWNVGAKVAAANDILHVNQDIGHRDSSRALIRDWVQALQDMIVERGRASA